MRRGMRRGGGGGMEFGGSGEDSFVAVVVTKLTGALLFILLLTMVIMVLVPKATDLPQTAPSAGDAPPKAIEIATPEQLPEAIAGRSYTLALAARGGNGPLRWSLDGTLPEGLTFDPKTALLEGVPKKGTSEPSSLVVRVSDGRDRAVKAIQLVVFESNRPLSTPSAWKPALPPIPLRAWLEQGFGFLVLLLVYSVGMNVVRGLERWSLGRLTTDSADSEGFVKSARGRFFRYRLLVRSATIAAALTLGVWLWKGSA